MLSSCEIGLNSVIHQLSFSFLSSCSYKRSSLKCKKTSLPLFISTSNIKKTSTTLIWALFSLLVFFAAFSSSYCYCWYHEFLTRSAFNKHIQLHILVAIIYLFLSEKRKEKAKRGLTFEWMHSGS